MPQLRTLSLKGNNFTVRTLQAISAHMYVCVCTCVCVCVLCGRVITYA